MEAALPDVSSLAPESDPEDEDEDEERNDEDEDEGTDKNKSKPKPRWFDRDRNVNKAHKGLLAGHDKLYKNMKDELDRMKLLQSQVSDLSSAERKQIEGDVCILRNRQTCVEAVLSSDSDLRKVIEDVDKSVQSSSGAFSVADPLRGLGKAPPCGSYKLLKTFGAWKKRMDLVLEAQSPDEIEHVKSESVKIKNPLSELLSAAKSASSDVNKAVKALRNIRKQQQQQQQAAPGKVPKKKGGATVQSGPSIFELLEYAEELPRVVEGQPVADTQCPAVIELSSAKQSKFEDEESIRKDVLTSFVELFNSTAPSQKLERGNKKFKFGSSFGSSKCGQGVA